MSTWRLDDVLLQLSRNSAERLLSLLNDCKEQHFTGCGPCLCGITVHVLWLEHPLLKRALVKEMCPATEQSLGKAAGLFGGQMGFSTRAARLDKKKKKITFFREPYFLRIFYFIFSKEIFIAFICKWKHDVSVYVMALGARLSHQLWLTRETFLFLA